MKKTRISFILLVLLIWLSLTGFQPLQQPANNPSQISSFLLHPSNITPLGPFGKQLPINNAVNQPSRNLTLQWGVSSPNVTYQYCLRQNKASCPPPKWINVGTNTSVTLQSLPANTRYYWQVRAVDSSNHYTYADNNTWWQFTTQGPSLPGTFYKLTPSNAQTGAPVSSLTLTWTTSNFATSYQYCVDKVNNNTCDFSWTGASGLSASVSGLSYNTTYYWQVRAVNSIGIVQADSGTWFSFHTQIAPPQTFAKLSPANTSPDKVPVNLTLQWSSSTGASEYYYCVDTTSHPDHDITCTGGTGWVATGTTESIHLSLEYNRNYYWQVRAFNSQGDLQADNGAWWSFTTIASQPLSFTKISPINGAIDQLLAPRLYWWTPSNPLTTYQYCIDYAVDCPSGIWTIVAENASIPITAPLNHNTTYYWQVRASSGGSPVYANDAWWSFTTLKASPTSSDQSFSTDENTPLAESLTAVSNYGKNFELYGSTPAGTLDFHHDGSFTYTPVEYFNGTITFQFVVSDGHNAPVGPYTVTITVNQVNNPPTLSPIPDQVVENGNQVTFWASGTDPDLPYGDLLTYSIDETLPSGASIDPVTGFFSWVVPINQGSSVFTFTVRVTDSGGLSAFQQVKITVISQLFIYIPIGFR